MIHLESIKYGDYEELYKIVKEAEPYMAKTMDIIGFTSIMELREGWTVYNDDEIIGCVSISDFIPKLNCILHAFVKSDYFGNWIDNKICNLVYGHIFNTLGCSRVTGYCLVGESDRAGIALEHMGFKQEGLQRQCALTDNGYHDVKTFGMLKEECPWL